VQRVSRQRLIAKKPLRRFLRFTRFTGSTTKIGAAVWAPGVDVPPFHPSGYMDRAPRLACPWKTVLTPHGGSAARFADLDPPQTFALRADEILRNERQTVWRAGRAVQRQTQGCNGFHGRRLLAKKRCAAFFVSPVHRLARVSRSAQRCAALFVLPVAPTLCSEDR
jgi:hypothetical protein